MSSAEGAEAAVNSVGGGDDRPSPLPEKSVDSESLEQSGSHPAQQSGKSGVLPEDNTPLASKGGSSRSNLMGKSNSG
eukprot:m.339087 g.339087  ORF g.339087 m.339087 type:complete len:77 (-) comp16542_c1_seq5:2958-3188(-)